MKNSSLFFLVVLMLVSITPEASAQWTTDPTVNTAVSVAARDQLVPRIVSDGAGGAIIVWQDYRDSATTGYDIYAQRLNAAGVVQWQPDGSAISPARGDQLYPALVADGAGGAIFVWSRSNAIYGQRVNASGTKQWIIGNDTTGILIYNGVNAQIDLSLVSDGAGGCYVVWEDVENFPNEEVKAQRVDSSGVVQWSSAVFLAAGIPYPRGPTPEITSDGSGGAIVTWKDQSFNIFAQRLNAAGQKLWTEAGVPVSTHPNEEGYPTIVSEGSGTALFAIIAWQRKSDVGDWNIFAQLLNEDGGRKWFVDTDTNGVRVCDAGGDQTNPLSISDEAGGIIVAWQDARHEPLLTDEIYASRVNHGGVVQWDSNGNKVRFFASVNARNHTITSDGKHGAIIAWQDTRDSGGFPTPRNNKTDIYVQRMDSSGTSHGMQMVFRFRLRRRINSIQPSQATAIMAPSLSGRIFVVNILVLERAGISMRRTLTVVVR